MHRPFGRSRRRSRLVPVTSRTHWLTMTQNVRNAAKWQIPVLLLGAVLFLAACGPDTTATTAAGGTSSATTSTVAASPATVPSGYHRKCELGQAVDKCPVVKDAPTPTTSAPKPKPAPPAAKPPTVAQQQALQAAQDYVDLSGFSKAGLLKQLTSSAGEGFNKADATWAVDHVTVDWNAEAVEAARSYLEMGGFSRAGLIKQLSSSYGDGFTKAQAQYAVKKVGL